MAGEATSGIRRQGVCGFPRQDGEVDQRWEFGRGGLCSTRIYQGFCSKTHFLFAKRNEVVVPSWEERQRGRGGAETLRRTRSDGRGSPRTSIFLTNVLTRGQLRVAGRRRSVRRVGRPKCCGRIKLTTIR